MYIKRIQLSAETFLLEAESRGEETGREVYCHAVGLGLGVWQVCVINLLLHLQQLLSLKAYILHALFFASTPNDFTHPNT